MQIEFCTRGECVVAYTFPCVICACTDAIPTYTHTHTHTHTDAIPTYAHLHCKGVYISDTQTEQQFHAVCQPDTHITYLARFLTASDWSAHTHSGHQATHTTDSHTHTHRTLN